MDDDPSLHGPLLFAWMHYEHKFEGRPVVDWYLEDRGRHLAPDERGWLQAQQRAWLSILEVTDVVPDARVEVRDLLTGRSRSVSDISGSQTLTKNLLVLGRVVDHDGVSMFCGTHPQPLRPLEGPDLVAHVQHELELPKAADPARRRVGDAASFLIQCWQDEIEEMVA